MLWPVFSTLNCRTIRRDCWMRSGRALLCWQNSNLHQCPSRRCSLFAGGTSGLMTKLKSIQSAAARLISKSGKFDHITLTLYDLHWLPVRRRVDFKVATLVHNVCTVLRHRISSMTVYQYPCCLVGSTMVGRNAQAVRPEDVHKLRFAIFRRFLPQIVEQPPNKTGNDQECYCFSPKTETTLIQSVITATRICGSD